MEDMIVKFIQDYQMLIVGVIAIVAVGLGFYLYKKSGLYSRKVPQDLYKDIR